MPRCTGNLMISFTQIRNKLSSHVKCSPGNIIIVNVTTKEKINNLPGMAGLARS